MNDEMRRRSWAGGGKEQGAGSEGAIGPSFSRHGESVQRRTRRIRVAAATGSVNCCRLDVKRRGHLNSESFRERAFDIWAHPACRELFATANPSIGGLVIGHS